MYENGENIVQKHLILSLMRINKLIQMAMNTQARDELIPLLPIAS